MLVVCTLLRNHVVAAADEISKIIDIFLVIYVTFEYLNGIGIS